LPATIGIRLEDKNKWERRVPLIPAHAGEIQRRSGHRIVVQPSDIRVFDNREYIAEGVDVDDRAVEADVLIAVKEIPSKLFRPGGVYVCFSHTVKGQDYNMPSLRILMERGATLVDYERIADDKGRRLIFFSIHAGYAGMIETLHAMGRRLKGKGVASPLAEVKPAYEYSDLAAAETHVKEIGQRLRDEGNGTGRPLVIGLSGYGNVSQGAQKILSWLDVPEVPVADLDKTDAMDAPLLMTVFREEDMVEPDGDHDFALQDYYDNPRRYRGVFDRHLPHLDMLVNTIYWTEAYPRLVTRDWAREQFADGGEARLQVIGDISIDIEGSIEMSVKATYPDNACYVYDPVDDTFRDGVDGRGLCIMAIDNLPCELPREASEHFSSILSDMVVDLGNADWSADFEALNLPSHLKKAVIVHKGELTPDYVYLQDFLKSVEGA
jgi:Alanine dehydrogenase/PNT, N-terminal domain/Alanine dehydrogenase/PNT, C-terminal domain